jgi:CRP-like cAMP-binding protein
MGVLNDLAIPLRHHARIAEGDVTQLESVLTLRGLRKGDPLVVRGTHPIAGIVAKGCLRVYFIESDGSDRVLYFAPEGWLVPDIESLVSTGSTALRIDALEPTDIWIPHDASRTLSLTLPDADRIWRRLAESALLKFQRRLVGGMRKSAVERYAEFRRLYPGLESRIAQYHIAAYLGISPEFLSKLRRRLAH